MDELPSRRVIAIPEILCLIIDVLDLSTLRAASLVCKAWHRYARQILWRQVIIVKDWFNHDLSPLHAILEHQGGVVKALSLELAAATRTKSNPDMDAIQKQLASLLSRLPNLESLNLQLPRDLKSSIVRTVAEHAKQLREFETDLLDWESEDVAALLRACPNVRLIAGNYFTGDVLKAIATTQPALTRIDSTHPIFDDNDFITFVQQLPDLVQLCVSSHQGLTTKALFAIAEYCHKIEHLGFHFCLSLQSSGFQALFKVCPNLRVLDLGLSGTYDADITLVAAQCPNLEKLKLPFCSNLTHTSILAIVQSCRHLKYLDISWCERVLLSIFNPATPWACENLRYLDISGIHASFEAEASVASTFLPSMYQQLGRFKHLEQLKLSGLKFSLCLLDQGRPYLSGLRRLEILDITKLMNPLPWKTLIEIGNWYPWLKDYQFRSSDVIPPREILEMAAMEEIPNGYVLGEPSAGAWLQSTKAGLESMTGVENGDQYSSTATSDTSDTSPPSSKRKRSRSPSPSPSSYSSSSCAEGEHFKEQAEVSRYNKSVVVDGIVKTRLRSGLEISFRISGEEEEGSEDDTPFSGGFPGGKPF